MFGFIRANDESLSSEELERYRAVYCGLCDTLGRRYGVRAKACVSFDLTFYILLCDSLHNAQETESSVRCLLHPSSRRPIVTSKFSRIASDLSILLAYQKLLDDIQDEKSKMASIEARAFHRAYEKARANLVQITDAVDQGFFAISQMESKGIVDADSISALFGMICARAFSYEQGIWESAMGRLGFEMGRFIYLMDASIDAPEDLEFGRFNPLTDRFATTLDLREVLEAQMGRVTEEFDSLPLKADTHLLRNILYEGVWQQFNRKYPTTSSVEGNGK